MIDGEDMRQAAMLIKSGALAAFGGMVGAGNDPRMAAVGWSQGLAHGQSVDEENAILAQQEAEEQDHEQERPREHEVDDVLGELMLAVADPHLVAAQAEARAQRVGLVSGCRCGEARLAEGELGLRRLSGRLSGRLWDLRQDCPARRAVDGAGRVLCPARRAHQREAGRWAGWWVRLHPRAFLSALLRRPDSSTKSRRGRVTLT